MVLAAHAGILLENAWLMSKQIRFNEELQQQVASQTKDILRKNQQLEDANLKLIESERMKGILSGTLVHDIKNYAAGIAGNLLYLNRRIENDPKAHRIIEVVGETCADITSMASNLLDVAKMDDGKMVLRREEIDIQFFEAMAEKFGKSALFEEKEIVTKIIAPEEEFIILADIYLLERVLQNLYSNAAKYAPKGSTVKLSFLQGHDENIVCFYNSGPPIPDSEKEILFEKYARLQNRQSHYSKGLGLFFCRMVLNAHGGRIWLDTDETGNYFKMAFACKESGVRLSIAS
jgi:two-component system sensor histidine kinase KdpD